MANAFYSWEFNIPAATPELTPVVVVREVMNPRLRVLRVVIPNGHQGLARLRIETRDNSILPTIGSDPMWIRGDGSTVEMEPDLLLPGPAWVLKMIGWNADALLDHSFLVYASLYP